MVLVLVSTRSPALNTGPLPANRLRTVRRTIRPSSAIQRRSQAPHRNRAPVTTVPTQKTALVETAGAGVSSRVSRWSGEVDSDTNHSDPRYGE